MRLIDADELRAYWEECKEYLPADDPKRAQFDAAIYDLDNSKTAVEVVRCADCSFFETDHLETINGIPLIVAHEICTKWGFGCKTAADGFCFLAERREECTKAQYN